MSFLFPSVEKERFSERSEKTFEVDPGGLLNFNTQLGSIHVDAGATSNVRIEVLLQVEAESVEKAGLKFKDLQVLFAQNGNDIEIHSEFKGRRKGLTLEFHISVPRNYNLKLKTGAGNVSVDGLEGQTDAETRGGSITIKQVNGEIKAVTKGGNVRARMRDQMVADCYLTTSGGKVIVELNDASAFDFDAKTSAGSLITEFPITMQGKLSGSCCKTSINGGGPKLVLRSAAGNIHLLKL